jgi:hypothetical protein
MLACHLKTKTGELIAATKNLAGTERETGTAPYARGRESQDRTLVPGLPKMKTDRRKRGRERARPR